MDARPPLSPTKYLLSIFALSVLMFASRAALAAPVNDGGFRPRLGMRPEIVTFKPNILHFVDVVVGQTYMQQVVLINSGRSAIGIWNVRGSNPSFRVRGLKLPMTISPGQSIGLRVEFIPTRNGKLDTDFTFTTSRNGRLALHADGDLVRWGLVSNPGKLSFGSVQVGSGARLAVTLANPGRAWQTVSRVLVSGDQFGIAGLNLPMALAPGESVTFSALFAPRWIGTAAGSIMVNARGINLVIPIGGEGMDSSQLGLSPDQLNFGNVTAGMSATLSGTLQAGRSAVTIYSAGITSTEFALSGLSFPLTIPAGQSRPYQVTFSPRASGSTAAALLFHGTMELSTQQALLGNAVPKTQHRVNLSWNPGNSSLVGYNIFRADSSEGQYTLINSAPDPNSSYLDSTVLGGHTYYYVTTAVASNGKQSSFSNQVEVVIP
jgi:hypothetical protein